jgi:phenylacetate-CoA ligase
MISLERDIERLLEAIEKSQWNHVPNMEYAKKFEVMSRDDLRAKKMKRHMSATRTSGSTGEPVTVEKTHLDYIWYMATNIREIRWRGWDVTKNIAVVHAGAKAEDINSWGIPKSIEANQGKSFKIGYLPTKEIQAWLEQKTPDYLHCAPSIVNQLDLSRIPSIVDHKGTGEAGGSMYSSEECGTIAIQCPDNPAVYHVMENQIVEVEEDGSAIITTTTNPYVKRYRHGDHLEMGSCACGRTLQTISKIKGRVRNMFVLPNGDRKWPLIGSKEYHERFGIKRFKAIQTSVGTLELHIISDPLGDREQELASLVRDSLGSPIEVIVKYAESFPSYKFEEFVSLV